MHRMLAAALLLFLAAPAARAQDVERIRAFDVDIQIAGNASFRVTEKIAYDFTDSTWKHGIVRDIPVKYGRGLAADYRIALDVEGVANERGAPWPFQVNPWDSALEGSDTKRNVSIKIGDPEKFVNLLQHYWIAYRVRRGLLYFPDHDELYWNATGNAWEVPIDAASATVYLPEGARAADPAFRAACFTGPFGAVESDCTVERGERTVTFRATRPMAPAEGLSIVLALPKGLVYEPTPLEKFLQRASDYVSPWFALPFGVFAYLFAKWRTSGRDPVGAAAVTVRYEPPEGMTPAELGLVIDEDLDMSDLTSTILDLAVRGWIEIEELESDKVLFLSRKDYVLRRLKTEVAGLRRHEAKLLEALFGSGKEVRVSSLKNKFYKSLPEIRAAVDEEVSKGQGWFADPPGKVRGRYIAVGTGLLFVAIFTGMFIAQFLSVAAPISLGLCGAVVLAFAKAMPARTAKGRRAYEEILGFKEFLLRVDADRLERSGGRTAGRFEKALPYAVVLGVADEWADAFGDIYTTPPNWYRSASYSRGFVPRAFVGDLGHSMSAIGRTMSSQPSGGSGSSGFSGGSSGGGFGGGGGRSW